MATDGSWPKNVPQDIQTALQKHDAALRCQFRLKIPRCTGRKFPTPELHEWASLASDSVTPKSRQKTALETLGLKTVESRLENLLEQAAKKEPSYADFLDELLTCEVESRRTRYLRARLQLAHFPFVKTFEQFDFNFQPALDERQIRELRSLRFIHDASNVIFLGPPGVGKTHLSVALAEEAIRSGLGAYFITAHDLAADLGRAYREGRLDRRMRVYLAPKVLVIDEVGYLPLDDLRATIFFQLVSARYERGSIILTSNKSYGDWGSIFGDSIIATAILDRLLHHSTTIDIRGESYRACFWTRLVPCRDTKKQGLTSQPQRVTYMKQHADFPRSAPDQRNLIEGKMAKNYSPGLGFGNPQKRKSAGSILFEFAIIVPVFLLLVLGGLDLLLATSAKSNLSYVAQETAACAASTPAQCPDLSDYATSLARGIGLNRPIAETTNACSGCVSVTVRVTTQPVGPFFPSINLVATAKATTGGGSGGSGG